MLRVVETFSGIGSQAKALKNARIKHEIVCTADWDINAIIAYDLIHHGKQDLTCYSNRDKQDMIALLEKYTLSIDGKKPATKAAIQTLSLETMKRLMFAIERSHNLVSITDVKAKMLPPRVDMLTYSFPCQDLSVAGNWHGNKSGIDREAHNRSGMLWEIERILKEMVEEKISLPKFLLMENVSNILSTRHRINFKEWTDYLQEIGYYNKIYTLDASKFGVPQKRIRTYMISVFIDGDFEKKSLLDDYFKINNLQEEKYIKSLCIPKKKLKEYVRMDYKNIIYQKEADMCQPNDTKSRQDIYEKNIKICLGNKVINQILPTVTTKQDRHPNSGVLDYNNGKDGKSKFRYLTPRECFLLMGFDETDYDNIVTNNFENRKSLFFNIEKLTRMAGNSIVVNVLEEIFKQINDIDIMISDSEIITEESNTSIEKIKSKLTTLFSQQNNEYQIIK